MKKEKKKAQQTKLEAAKEKRVQEKKTNGLFGIIMEFLKTLRGMEERGLTEKKVSVIKKIDGLGTAKYGYRTRIGLTNQNKKIVEKQNGGN